LLIFAPSVQYRNMEQTSKLQKAAVELVSKYFGQSTAETYNHFFDNEPDESILTSVREIMVDYIGKKKAEDEIKKIMEHLAL